MLNQLKTRKKESGFTIIEVLIVLAIAGLILLIVFLAVPALQRSARNTTIKNDASVLSGAISEWNSNNNGAAFTSALIVSGTGPFNVGTSTTTQAQAKVNGTTVVQAPVSTATPTVSVNTLTPDIGFTCAGNPSTRAVSVWYGIETSGSAVGKGCVDAS